TQEGFSGNANHDRSIPCAELLKPREQLETVLKRFPETNARIKRNRHGVNIINYGARILLSKKISNFYDNVRVMRRDLHHLRSSLHVHDDESGFGFGNQRQHFMAASYPDTML